MKAIVTLILSLVAGAVFAQYAPAAGQPGSTAIHKDSSSIVSWATNAIIERGWQDIADTTKGKTTTGTSLSPTDKAGINGVVSLGDGGSATLTFSGRIYDGLGADFVVFENSVANFLELAFVEVSSDGINFFRFDAVSLTQDTTQVASFATLDPTKLYNFAGKYAVGYGVPFDLNELAGTPGLDVQNITHVRIVDVVGSISEGYATYDSQNNKVNDPYPTNFPTGGFDLDAVGVINITAVGIDELNNNNVSLFPNPTNNVLNIHFPKKEKYSVYIQSISGKTLITKNIEAQSSQLNLSDLDAGIYFVSIQSNTKTIVKRIVKQ